MVPWAEPDGPADACTDERRIMRTRHVAVAGLAAVVLTLMTGVDYFVSAFRDSRARPAPS